MYNPTILLAEDDIDLGRLLKQYLEVNGYNVKWAKTGKEALDILQEKPQPAFSLALLDVMMPEMDGFQLAENLVRIVPELPFIFLTARKLKEDKIKGLKLGADDYIVKPFDMDVLLLKIQNRLKRTLSQIPPNTEKMQIGNYHLDAQNHLLLHRENQQKLTEKEVALIRFLFNRKNRLLKREEILQAIWKSDDYFSGRSMDVFISRLRKYFQDDPHISIESRRGIGLIFHIKT